MRYIAKSDLDNNPVVRTADLDQALEHKRARFARGMAAAEFGDRYYGWRDGEDHNDLDPEALAERRFRAIWGPR